TVFPSSLDGVNQRIIQDLPVEVEFVDLTGMDTVEALQAARARARKAAAFQFDLVNGPLVRAEVGRLHASDVGLLTLHHIVADGWSIGVLVEELESSYKQFRAGRIPSLGALPLRYIDYSAWQKRLLDSERMEEQRDYWLKRLAGPLPRLDVPARR